jgi:hypothetical protein
MKAITREKTDRIIKEIVLKNAKKVRPASTKISHQENAPIHFKKNPNTNRFFNVTKYEEP